MLYTQDAKLSDEPLGVPEGQQFDSDDEETTTEEPTTLRNTSRNTSYRTSYRSKNISSRKTNTKKYDMNHLASIDESKVYDVF